MQNVQFEGKKNIGKCNAVKSRAHKDKKEKILILNIINWVATSEKEPTQLIFQFVKEI